MEIRSKWKMLDKECFRIYAPCYDPISNMDGFEFYQLNQEHDIARDNQLYYVMHLEVFPDYPDYPEPCPNGPQYIYAPDTLRFCGVESLAELKDKFGDGWRLKLAEAWFEICMNDWMVSAGDPMPWGKGVKVICDKTGYVPGYNVRKGKIKNMENTNNQIGEWILTDSDSFQICRERKDIEELTGDKTFELYQLQVVTDEKYVTAHEIISLSDIDVPSVIECYGYKNLDQIKEEYGEDWEQILSECAFELSAGNYENVLIGKYFQWEEGVEFICRLSGYRLESSGLKEPEAGIDITNGDQPQ